MVWFEYGSWKAHSESSQLKQLEETGTSLLGCLKSSASRNVSDCRAHSRDSQESIEISEA